MKIQRAYTRRVFLTAFFCVMGWVCLGKRIQAQSLPGDNAVYSSTGAPTFSHSFIDASVLFGTDVCQKINTALTKLSNATNYPAGAAVIDARGIAPGSTACSASPWYNLSSFPPAVILLPAGTIIIKNMWVLPDRTRIIGEGSGASGTGNSGVTTIQATSTFSPAAMIEMGSTSGTGGYTCPSNGTANICTGIGVEDLKLDGNQVAGLNGIVNDASQELSYVNRVELYQIEGIGLLVGSISGGVGSTVGGNQHAQNSGPYTNIRFDTGSETPNATGTICAQILGYPTRGIHGLTCLNNSSTTPDAAVLVDSFNNSIEDVYVQGFVDGIVIGADAASATSESSNVLLNISGSLVNGSSSYNSNLIHLCRPTTAGLSSPNCVSTSGPQISDTSILGATNSGTSPYSVTIQDDETQVGSGIGTLGYLTGDTHVGAYILGEQVAVSSSVNAYSRFSTSPRVPTWVSGSGSAGGSCSGSNPAKNGSLYSNTSGGSGTTLYACVGGNGLQSSSRREQHFCRANTRALEQERDATKS